MSERHETLAIRNLRLDVAQSGNDIVDEVTLTIARGEMLGLVGESGSGKTTVGLAGLGHARKGVGIHSGTVSIEGTDVLAAHGKDLRRARGRLVSYVPQVPGISTSTGPSPGRARQFMCLPSGNLKTRFSKEAASAAGSRTVAHIGIRHNPATNSRERYRVI